VTRTNVLEEAATSRFANVEDAFEAVAFSIVRIRDLSVARGFGIEASKKLDLAHSDIAWCHPSKIGEVGSIHGDDVVENLEVFAHDLTRPAPKLDPAALARRARSRIRRLANVPSTGSSAVDLDVSAEVGSFDEPPHRGFSRWRPADVAETDETDANLHDCGVSSTFPTF
jgi:hypothetical protein